MTAARPRFVDCWDNLAAVAADLLRRREDAYPALVESGKMTAEDAEHGLRVMRAIAADWRRLAARFEPAATDARIASRCARIAALEHALKRCYVLIGKGRMERDYALCVEAMLYHERSFVGGPGQLADLNIALRVALAAQRVVAANQAA